jgi:drug/metabolite transporter (DMT)-like permease
MIPPAAHPHTPVSPWRVGLALGLVYLAWGTTYAATGEGVKTMPPGLFGGTRLFLAGTVLLGFLMFTGRRATLPGRELAWNWLVGACMFVGGNGLINVAQKTVPSGVASVLVATTPLFMAVLETAWPTGERLSARGWLGLLAGLGGVVLLMADKLHTPTGTGGAGYLLVLGSAFCWALGAFLQRRRRHVVAPLTSAAWQMFLGGGSLALVGCCAGECRQLTADCFTPVVIAAFFYLLVVGSLIGYVAFNWLLGHVSVGVAGSYAYVNPVVALLVGWMFLGETLAARVIGGMAVILAGVALVRSGHRPVTLAEPEDAAAPPEKRLPAAPGRFTVTERNGVQGKSTS